MFEQTFKNIDDILHKDGKIEHHKALTGDDLKDFVDHKLFPYLKKFKTSMPKAPTPSNTKSARSSVSLKTGSRVVIICARLSI